MMPNKNWKDVPVPKNIQDHCETDKRGMPVPFVVLKDDSGVHHFKINDTEKSLKCFHDNLCTICGQRLPITDRWLVGGIASAFDKDGAYIDLPVHKECGHYTLQVCPYLANSNYASKKVDTKKLEQKINGTHILVDPTIDLDRLPLFAFIRPLQIMGFKSKLDSGDIRIKAFGPYPEVEFWDDGHQITDIEEVRLALMGTKWEKYLPAIYEQFEVQFT